MEKTDVFEEWGTYAKKKALLARDIDLEQLERGSGSKIMAITGIRRAGKSSVLMLLAQKLEADGKKVAYVNLEDSRLSGVGTLDDILKWFGEDGFLLLDEVTSAHDWEGWLARVHELLSGRLRLVVSSSRKGLALPNKPLRGRIIQIEMFPLSFREFLFFRKVLVEKTTVGRGRLEKAFLEYLKYGGFPEVVLAGDETDKVRILGSYFKDIVGLDIAEVSHQDPSKVEAFGRYALQSTYFSASKCLNFFKTVGHKIGKEKLLQLEKYSEAGYLFFFTPIFSYNIKDKAQYPRKAYCGDTGFYHAMGDKAGFGRLYENAAFLELRRRTQEIAYWKNKDGLETDFVLMRGSDTVEALQVVYELEDAAVKKREFGGITACADELKPKRLIILTKDKAGEVKEGGHMIRLVPLMDWLLDVGANTFNEKVADNFFSIGIQKFQYKNKKGYLLP
ncbi:MAG: ATP-binding protein [Candidatus Micrarchaeia archaeon]